MKIKKTYALLLAAVAFPLSAQRTLTVSVKPGAEINPDMYGIFFEDINFGADGGLYAELVKNRSFEFDYPLMGWTPFGEVSVETEAPAFDRNPHYVRLTEKGSYKRAGLQNEGFVDGMSLVRGKEYRLTFYARLQSEKPVRVKVEFVTLANNPMTSAKVEVASPEWQKYTLVMKAGKSDAHARLRLTVETKGVLDIDHVSLFPVDTWKGRENGLRRDLVQALYDLKPGVFRFPGGCIVEGSTLESRYQWKNSVGPVENRPYNDNRWNYTFRHRLYPDYYQSYGLGFYEYFLLCEDIGAEPLPVLNCGMGCQYQSGELVPLDEMDPYVQDAIDLVEFANGDTTTTWGALRARMGHPAPFGLKYLGIGNEQWGEEFVKREALFVEALRKHCPGILIVGSSGPSADGEQFEYLWPEMKRLKVDFVDEHYYKPPEWFYANAGRYDRYDRKGPKVYAGEYASHHKSRANNFEAALSEAAFLTGVERNADVVRLATYAPLLAHVDAWQWRPDMIWFDNSRVLLTPNYYVQQLYSRYKGTHTLRLTEEGEAVKGTDGLYASAVYDADSSRLIVKVANTASRRQEVVLQFEGLKRRQALSPEVSVVVMQSDDKNAVNTFENPEAVVPQRATAVVEGNSCRYTLAPQSFQVIIIPIISKQ